MYIIFGIRNKGDEYSGTRHNVGSLFADFCKKKFEDRSDILIEYSNSFVNLSGIEVKKLVKKHNIGLEQLIIAHDDLDISFGRIKMSFGKDAAGHRGVQSVIDQLGTNRFWRVRIGIANDSLPGARNQSTLEAKQEAVGGFVLSQFAPGEREHLPEIFEIGFQAIDKMIE